MAHSHNPMIQTILPLICVVLASAMATAGARPLNFKPSDLLERLKLDGEEGSSTCWDSLFELQSCTGEVVLFFLNGETYLGPSCCAAIETIEHQCWPAMLGSLGYTDEEGDILRGYCDESDSSGNSTGTGTGTGITPYQPSSPPQTANITTTTTINATSHV